MSTPPGPSFEWSEEGGVIRLSFISLGLTGPEWLRRFQESGVPLEPHTIAGLNSERFTVTPKGEKATVPVIRASALSEIDLFHADEKRAELGLDRPLADAACHVFELAGERGMLDMRLSRIVFMHDAVGDDLGDHCVFQIVPSGGGLAFHAARLVSFVRDNLLKGDSLAGFAYRESRAKAG